MMLPRIVTVLSIMIVERLKLVVKTSRLLLHLTFLEKHIVRFKRLQASYGIKVYLISVFFGGGVAGVLASMGNILCSEKSVIAMFVLYRTWHNKAV
jgi:hypothetical protein